MGEVLEGQLDLAVAQAPVLIQPLLRLAFACRHFELQGAFRFFLGDVALDRLLQLKAASLCSIIENYLIRSFIRFCSDVPLSIICDSYCNDMLCIVIVYGRIIPWCFNNLVIVFLSVRASAGIRS